MQITKQLIGDTRIPFVTMKGDKPGRRVVVVSGMHGGELTGMKAAHCLIEIVNIARGTLYVIPSANAQGITLGMRNAPIDLGWRGIREGDDLNRSFVGRYRSGTTKRLAWQIYNLVRDVNPTVVIDLHNWVDPATNFAIIDRPLNERACFATSHAEAFARVFGVPMCHDLPRARYVAVGHDKSLTGALVNHAHIPAFTVELGGAYSAKNVFIGVTGLLNVLKHCNMLTEDVWVPRIAQNENADAMRLEEVCKKGFQGEVRYWVKPGQLVVADAQLATLFSANHDCVIGYEFAKQVGIILALGPKKHQTKSEPLVTMAVCERRMPWKKGEFGRFLDCQSASTST